jgi:hypothetical protein
MGPTGIKKLLRENFKIATISSRGGDFTPVPFVKVTI